jgi:hypothetical protein
MAQFTKGSTFNDGVENDLTSAKLHALIESAVPTSNLITDQTLLASLADADKVLWWDQSASALTSVLFSTLKTTIAAAVDTSTTIRSTISQTAHGFIVGDVVHMGVDGDYAKASCVPATGTSASIDTGTDQITFNTGHGLTDKARVIFTAGPADFSSARVYYAKLIGADVFEFYLESSQATIVDITATTAATVYHSFPDGHAVGVVSNVPDVNSFKVDMGGEVTGLAGLSAGKTYYLSATAGSVTTDIPNADHYVCVPVYVALSSSTAMVLSSPTPTLSEGQIKRNDLIDDLIDESKLDHSAATHVAADKVLFLDASHSDQLRAAAITLPESYSGTASIPAAGGTASFTHGLTGEPQHVRVVLKRTHASVGDSNHDENDEVDIAGAFENVNGFAAFAVTFDASDSGKIKVTRTSGAIQLTNYSTGSSNLMTPEFAAAEWDLKVYATYFS